MALKIPGLKALSKVDAKTRVFLVFAIIAGLSLVIFFLVRYFFGEENTAGASKIATAPANMQTVPGGKITSPEYYRALVQSNAQIAKQAQISGGSAVPTLINVPEQQTNFASQDCTILCPSDDNADVALDINELVKQNKLSQEDANHLLELAKNNVSVEEYAEALNDLVKKGKLTPEQARLLLEKYRKQHGNNAISGSAKLMDSMIKAGQLPLDVANQLLALQKSKVSPADYAAELNRLVREGKLTPAQAAQLLAQYTQQQMQDEAQKGIFGLKQMAKAGEITPDVAANLTELQKRNTPVDQYEAELNRLVAAGKMTPAAAAKLLGAYKKQRDNIGTMGILTSLVGQAEREATGTLNDLVNQKKISPETASELLALQQKAVSPEDYQNALAKLVQAKKISPEDAQKALAAYKKLVDTHAAAQRLAKLQGNNASLKDYADELQRSVQAGIISPAAATSLYEQYRAILTPVTPPGGVAPGIEANIPANAEFATLQERVQANAAAQPLETVQFKEGPPPPPAAIITPPPAAPAIPVETAEERNARIAAIQAAMSNQAQSLLAAWKPPVMVHREGTPVTEKVKVIQEGGEGARVRVETKEKGIETSGPRRVLIKAGKIAYAVLDTTVDSDYPDTPVMATIVAGDLKGAKLLGKLSLVKDKDKISLIFNLMDKDEWPSAKSINAFAIDPDTARTVMASSVDHHYLKKYGAIMATSFLAGYANAISQAGTSTTGIFGTSTTHPALPGGDRIAIGLGQIGTTMGAAIAPWINTQNTVKVNSGVGLGILFMSEVTE